MTTQTAALFTAPQVPVSVQQRRVPKPQAGDVLVKVTAAGINPVDAAATVIKLPFLTFPCICGYDGAGEVAALGDGVTSFSVGDRVFWQANGADADRASFQQYTLVSADQLGRTPSNMTDDAAATIGVTAGTALAGLFTPLGYNYPAPWLRDGDKIGEGKALIVLGGSSSVGQYAIQFAALAGFYVISNSSPAHHGRVRQLGAAEVLDRNTATKDDYAKALGGRPLAALFDAISSDDTFALCTQIISALKGAAQPTPSQVAVVRHPGESAQAQAQAAGFTLNMFIGITTDPQVEPVWQGFLKAAGGENGLFLRGSIVPSKTEVIGGLTALPGALDRVLKGVSGVKLITRPHQS